MTQCKIRACLLDTYGPACLAFRPELRGKVSPAQHVRRAVQALRFAVAAARRDGIVDLVCRTISSLSGFETVEFFVHCVIPF
jgi:hypothetical protein